MKRMLLILGTALLLASGTGCILLSDEEETTMISPMGIETWKKHPCHRHHVERCRECR